MTEHGGHRCRTFFLHEPYRRSQSKRLRRHQRRREQLGIKSCEERAVLLPRQVEAISQRQSPQQCYKRFCFFVGAFVPRARACVVHSNHLLRRSSIIKQLMKAAQPEKKTLSLVTTTSAIIARSHSSQQHYDKRSSSWRLLHNFQQPRQEYYPPRKEQQQQHEELFYPRLLFL